MLDALKNGTGPYPRSLYGTDPTIVNIDYDKTAIYDASNLCAKLGERTDGMVFECQDAANLTFSLETFDVVFLAALVGATQEEKELLLLKIVDKMTPGRLVVIRTAHSLRTVLYPEFDYLTKAITERLEVKFVVHPHNEVVNSVVVGKVRVNASDKVAEL
jgi:nicotianamine synthase